VTCYIPRWFIRPQTVTHPSTNWAQCRLTTLIEADTLTTTLCHHPIHGSTRLATNCSGNWSLSAVFWCYSLTNKKLSYRRETVRQLPTCRGLSPPVHSPSPSGYTYAYGRIQNRNPQQMYMYVKRAVHKAHFKLNQAFKVIQGHPYLCRQEPRAVYCRNVQLMPPLFLKLTKMWQQEHSKFVDFNDPTHV